jgi:2Fe-2S ferredoxin
MPVIRVLDRDRVEHEVAATAGLKVMEILRELDYGVAAICGGMCACATCHVVIHPQWLHKLPAPTADELELLGGITTTEGSRLSCQIEFTGSLDGLALTIAPEE